MKSRCGLIGLSASAVLAATIGVGTASAKPVTVGSPLQGSFPSMAFTGVGTAFNVTLPESGAHVTSPISGTVADWHVRGALGGPLFLIVATPNSGGSYTGGAVSSGHSLATTALHTFSTDLPIKAGQTVGLSNSHGSDKIGVLASSAADFVGIVPPLTTGATASPVSGGQDEIGFNAVIQPLPAISKLRPRSASHKGGKKITIKGKNFDGTTKVLFGKKAAKSFKVISDTKIKAVAPAHHTGTVRVTVLNPGRSAKVKASKFKFTP